MFEVFRDLFNPQEDGVTQAAINGTDVLDVAREQVLERGVGLDQAQTLQVL